MELHSFGDEQVSDFAGSKIQGMEEPRIFNPEQYLAYLLYSDP